MQSSCICMHIYILKHDFKIFMKIFISILLPPILLLLHVYEGNMSPGFGAAVFDPEHKLHDIIGPVVTPFGWHLIYILTRELPNQNYVKMEL